MKHGEFKKNRGVYKCQTFGTLQFLAVLSGLGVKLNNIIS